MIIHSGEPIFVGFTPEAKLVSIKLLIRAREGGAGVGRGTEGSVFSFNSQIISLYVPQLAELF